MNKRKLLILGIDFFLYAASFAAVVFLGLLVEGNFSLRDVQVPWGLWLASLVLMGLLTFVFRYEMRIYRCVWRFAGTQEYVRLLIADGCGGLCFLLLDVFLYFQLEKFLLKPDRALLVIMAAIFVTLFSRFIYQLLYRKGIHLFAHRLADEPKPEEKRKHSHKIAIAIVGAGRVGASLAEELQMNPAAHYTPLCFVDNDAAKIGQYVAGLKVYEENEFVQSLVHEIPVQEIVFALPDVDGAQRQRLYELYRATGCKIKAYDNPISEPGKKRKGKKVREFRIEDLLFRPPLAVQNEDADSYYRGKTVMVTGGGGSIGSELCRQIAKLQPKNLIILDIYENNAYQIQQELIRTYGDALPLRTEIASVRDRERLECVFAAYRPQVVFHAAAHKHVPLMEHSCCEAIKNNVLGTYNTADMAEKYGVEKFILISTDKAVNPTNVMGASKRMCEMVIQCRTDSKTEFAAVRFGNVLGSNGSVIPLFEQQIAKGGPVTITDKRIVRYFMTIPEAAQLVMQAGAMAKDGELFVLDMGKPVRIVDLAENMIRLSGYTPYEDIEIKEIGLRPGEKLYEELLMKSEKLDKTENKMIFIERDTPLTRAGVEEKLRILLSALEAGKDEVESEEVKLALKQTVPTYHAPEEVNEEAEKSEEMQEAKRDDTLRGPQDSE